ncbi:acyltransferase family protein, partial [Paracoccus marcusii]|uniref:acyltransferase family protein n=1 Tax=Paracoccus marcusii TaxID=59779 RepID=UPI001112612B
CSCITATTLDSRDESLTRFVQQSRWNPQNFIGGVPRVTFSFVIGILILRFAPKVKLGSTVPLLLALAIIPILAAGPRKWWIDFGVVTFVFPALVYYAASWQPTGPFKSVAQWLGRISYPLYIIHMPALYFASTVVAKWELSGADKAVVFVATVLGTIIISALLPRFYDEPIRRAASKMISRNTARSKHGASSAF